MLRAVPGVGRRALPTFLKPILAACLLAAGLWLGRPLWPDVARFAGLSQAPAPSASVESPARSEAERAARATRACLATRARVARGASVGPSDVEGWVVELTLLGPSSGTPLPLDSLLEGFVVRRSGAPTARWVWPGSARLAAIQRFDANVEVSSPSGPGALGAAGGVRLVFHGPYVTPYFNEFERADYLLLADALAERASASYGALYAHCAGQGMNQLGSWFSGPSPGGALGALVYFMLADAGPSTFRHELLGQNPGELDRSWLFDHILQAAVGVDRTRAATLIGPEQGMIAGRPEQRSRLTFPFRDANRASRAALGVARALALTQAD